MAETYKLKYYADFSRSGYTERIEIHILTEETITPLRIGNIVSIGLKNQGSADNIDAPIVKTLLDITFVDQWDKEVTDKTKFGDWEEFYTSDAVLYKVIYLQDGSARWTGFLTPDSWTEKLEYHGTITITARDMIGHMQDFPFDLSGDKYGMATVKEIIEKGLEKASVPMAVGTDLGSIGLSGGIVSDSTRRYDVSEMLVNVECFEGKTWYDAVEDILDSLGMTLRYADNNVLFCGLLKDMPSFVGEQADKDVLFVNRTGTRELSPACRKIVDVTDFKNGPAYSLKMYEDDLTETTKTIMGNNVKTWVPKSGTRMSVTGDIGVMNHFMMKGDSRNPGSPIHYMDNAVFLSVRAKSADSLDESAKLSIIVPVGEADINFKLAFNLHRELYKAIMDRSGNFTGRFTKTIAKDLSTGVRYGIRAIAKSGQTRYLNEDGEWKSKEASLTASVNGSVTDKAPESQITVEVSLTTPTIDDGIKAMAIDLYGFHSHSLRGNRSGTSDAIVDTGYAYGMISELKLTQTSRVSASHTTTTMLSERNNVIIERSSALGQVPTAGGSKVILNGFYMPEDTNAFPSVQSWWISGSEGEAGHLDVIKHKMLLCYHCRPLNVLSGNVYDNTAENPHFNDIFIYNRWAMIAIGGTLNILTGRITGASLREFATWDELWRLKEVTVSPTSLLSLDVSQGTYSLSISAPLTKSWTISGTPSWITLSKSSGTGSSEVSLIVSANITGSLREAILTVADKSLVVSQRSLADWAVSTRYIQAGPLASSDTISVDAPGRSERWGMRTSDSWLNLTNAGGVGDGTVTVSWAANSSSSARTGTITLRNDLGDLMDITVRQRGKKSLAYIDADTCLECGACDDILAQVCPQGVIRNGTELVGNCIGCMMCRDAGVESICIGTVDGATKAFRFTE